MALPGAHPDSFPSTSPFGVTAATYFLGMTALLGSAISSTIIGSISDRVGRKPCMLLCLGVGSIGAIVNYLARETFWGFCAANFAQGLFAASIPVAMAYVSDVKQTRKEKDKEIGILVALGMLGISGGGVCAILMESQGLFTPLFIGAVLNAAAFFAAMYGMIEPKKYTFIRRKHDSDDDSLEEQESPKTLDHKVLGNVIVGALLDNIGSSGLLPMAMAPLALNEFYINFLEEGVNPIMSQSAFKWISVMVALTIIPGAAISQPIFDKIGAAAGCVIGNVVTGIVTIAVLHIARMQPASDGTFAAFIVALYVGFPFTVLSQLSTGPMLDSLAPEDRRGYVQGLNIAVMNLATAVTPYLLGEMADNIGISEAMWTCIGISFFAALVNVPLMFVKALKRPKKRAPRYARSLGYEDPGFVDKVMRGEWVSAQELELLNDQRMRRGDPFLVIPYNAYEEDKQHLREIKRQARSDFLWVRQHMGKLLNDPALESVEARQALLEQYTAARPTDEQKAQLAKGLSTWFADYLMDNGYWMDDSPILYKQMIMQAFPPLLPNHGDLGYTAENIEEAGINYLRVLNKYLDDSPDLSGVTRAFAGRVVSV